MTLLCLLLLACGGKSAEGTEPTPGADAAVESREAEAMPVEATQKGEPDEGGVKAPGNLPVMTESELADQDAVRLACVDTCVADRVAEGDEAELVRNACFVECEREYPSMQVEVVPDGPIAPPIPPG